MIIGKNTSKVFKAIIKALYLTAVSFVVVVFSRNEILLTLASDEGYELSQIAILYPRTVGAIAFVIEIYALIKVISLSGWLYPTIGVSTTIIGTASGLLILRLP